ncbi:hypothetical protein DCN14_13885 [Burkholderia sp. IDO3]|nr:hypothetical protein DCN14_13885 [Burkholderia sp. IDO3]
MARIGTIAGRPFDARGSRGRSDRGAAPKCDAHRTGGRRSAHRRRRPGIRGMCRPDRPASRAAAPSLARRSLYHPRPAMK